MDNTHACFPLKEERPCETVLLSCPFPRRGGCDSSDPLRGAISGEDGRDAFLLLPHTPGQMLLLFLGLAHTACTLVLASLPYKFCLYHAMPTTLCCCCFVPLKICYSSTCVIFFCLFFNITFVSSCCSCQLDKKALHMLRTTFLRAAALNPLKDICAPPCVLSLHMLPVFLFVLLICF